jgi:hypothetical protein
MYYIDYNNNQYLVSFNKKEIDYIDANYFLNSIHIYYDKKNKKHTFNQDKILDTIALLDYYQEEYLLSNSAKEAFENKVKSYIPKQKYFRNVKFDESLLNPNIELFNFQKEGLNFTLSRSRSYVADDPGLGKTITAICTFTQWFADNKIDKLIIIVKTGLSYTWVEEILNTVNYFSPEDIVVIQNENKLKAFDNYPNVKIFIIANHLLKPLFLSYKKNTDIKKSASKIHWKEFVNLYDKLSTKKLGLIVDEAHELTNSKAISTKALMSHIHFFDFICCLSATPTGNYFEKYFNSLQLCDSTAVPFTEIAFKCYISESMGTQYNPYAILEYKEDVIEEFKNKVLRLYFLKRNKRDLPEMKYKKIVKPIYLEMSDRHKSLYRIFIQDEILKMEREKGFVNFKAILNKFPYLSMIVDNPLLLKGRVESQIFNQQLNTWKIENDDKFQFLGSLVESYVKQSGKKILIFDNHPDTIDLLSVKFKEHKPLRLHGKMGYSEEDKKKVAELFNDKQNENRILIANPQVGGVGYNFNKGTNHIIFYTLPNDSVLYTQALDRCDRIDNTTDALVDILLYRKSIDILRYMRNINRLKLNEDFLNKALSREELKNLLELSVSRQLF